ncbi:MAG: hypothetical protein IIB69_11795 [Proteobacteria bacterium]|nr:hypothetical protein [Pseudomonadota bacterium]
MKSKTLISDPIVVIALIILAICVQWLIFGEQIKPSQVGLLPQQSLEEIPVSLPPSREIDTQINDLGLDNQNLEQQIRALLHDGIFKQARTELLEVAALAASRGDEKQISNTLLLLGEVAIDEQELAAAEVFLQEALDIAIEQGDVMTTAHTYRQLGRLNIKSRELARSAGETYDKLWVVRSQIYQGDYRNVIEDLERIIDASLQIRRYGAAASAWETLSDYHNRFHDNYLATQAASEAAKLYASSGQLAYSRAVVDRLIRNGLSLNQLETLNQEIHTLFEQHQEDMMRIAQAKDLQLLYRHYKGKGENKRAWNLRIKASQALAKTSERSMYQRQSEVMAILYSSTFAMKKAKRYLRQAGALYAAEGVGELYLDARDMQEFIY